MITIQSGSVSGLLSRDKKLGPNNFNEKGHWLGCKP